MRKGLLVFLALHSDARLLLRDSVVGLCYMGKGAPPPLSLKTYLTISAPCLKNIL